MLQNLKNLLIIAVLSVCLVAFFLPVVPVSAADGSSPFQIAIWTDKSGPEETGSGGTYQVGEELTIFIQTNRKCQATLVLNGPQTINQFNGVISFDPGIYSILIGSAEASDIGLWNATFQAASLNEGQLVVNITWEVVPAGATAPGPSPSLQPQSPSELTPDSSLTETEETPAATVDAQSSTELLALMALKMTEGVLTADPRMDADGDGQVTIDDVRLILQWAVEGSETQPIQPSGQDNEVEIQVPGGQDNQVELQEPAGQDNQMKTQGSDTADMQACLGKWQMTRQSIQPAFPDAIPEFVINQIIPEKSTWEIESVGNDLTIKYDGRDTWYKKLLLGKGMTEGATTASAGNQNASCVFRTPVQFYWSSLPFPIGVVVRDIKEIRGSFTDTVTVNVSGNNIQAVVTTENIQGTYLKVHDNGSEVTEQIYYSVKAVYKGTRK